MTQMWFFNKTPIIILVCLTIIVPAILIFGNCNKQDESSPIPAESEPTGQSCGIVRESTFQNQETAKDIDNDSLAEQSFQMGKNYYNEKDYIKAESCYSEALKYESDNPYILNNLGITYLAQDNHENGIRSCTTGIRIMDSAGISDTVLYTALLSNLASLYRSNNQYDKAEPLYRLAIQMDEEAVGEDSLYYAIDLNNMASMLAANNPDGSANRYDSSLEFYQKALHIFMTQSPSKQTYMATTYNNMSILFLNRNNQDTADMYQKSADSIYNILNRQ